LYTKVNIMITLSKDQRHYYKINIIKHLYENKSHFRSSISNRQTVIVLEIFEF